MVTTRKAPTANAEKLQQQLAALEKRVASKDALISQLRKKSANSKSTSGSSKSRSGSAKQQKVDDTCALDKNEVLDEIFSFVGGKEWAFVAGVCRRWRGRYFSMCVKAARAEGAHVHPFNTSYRSTWATRARFALALEYGMPVVAEADSDSDSDSADSDNDEDDDCNMFHQLSLFSSEPVEVMTLARKHGAVWHPNLVNDAAYYGDATLMQWLIASGCPWDLYATAVNAIRSCDIENHDWLESSIIKPADDAMLSKLMCEAGFAGNVGVLHLLRSNGAVWPESFLSSTIRYLGEIQHACWNDEAVEWAISQGSGWRQWSCKQLVLHRFAHDDIKSKVENLFEWAHENGCPCTCKKTAAAAAAAAAAGSN
eukprot:13117-Heterococcus_DN1.PRE.2